MVVVLGGFRSPDLGIPEETGVFARKVLPARKNLPARKRFPARKRLPALGNSFGGG